jgi:HEAT repeat protein
VFGYTHYYQSQLSLRNSSIALCTAADKLGRIGDISAVDPLCYLLNHKNSEVVTVVFRAVCRIGTNNALQHVLIMLPTLLKDGRVTVKVIQTSLLLFGSWAGDMLLQYARTNDIPEVRAVILETLVTFPLRQEITEFALAMLSHPDPEVRGKALKVIARGGLKDFSYDSKVFLKLLDDPVWFVRLQAAKTIGKVKCENFIDMLKKLALDERWQVRDAATLALVELGDESLDAFLELLETPDRYAKESISEEIQRTGFVLNLIEYLGGFNLEKKAKAERILSSMHSVGFSTPLRELLETGKSHPDITAGLKKILFVGASL